MKRLILKKRVFHNESFPVLFVTESSRTTILFFLIKKLNLGLYLVLSWRAYLHLLIFHVKFLFLQIYVVSAIRKPIKS